MVRHNFYLFYYAALLLEPNRDDKMTRWEETHLEKWDKTLLNLNKRDFPSAADWESFLKTLPLNSLVHFFLQFYDKLKPYICYSNVITKTLSLKCRKRWKSQTVTVGSQDTIWSILLFLKAIKSCVKITLDLNHFHLLLVGLWPVGK